MTERFVHRHLPYLLARASHAIWRGFEPRLRAAGLNSLEWRVLATLSDSPPLAVGELAREVLAQQPEGLLLRHRAGEFTSELIIADILAAACAGSDHLWQDLGLAGREQLSRLMWLNFPALARANSGDMKWKKFLYRQLCSSEGIYVCPAPSCGVCKDYAKCFGPEN